MVAVAAEYRLSSPGKTTPVEAMADARAVIGWMRLMADSLGIDPRRVAAYGWSAGAHLAASAAVFIDSVADIKFSTVPDALILVSPAVHLESDGFVSELLGPRMPVSSISPASHVRKGMPPALILIGETDTVTPLAGARLFHKRMRDAGNVCELKVYPGVGHLFTPSSIPDDGWPQPDSKVQADALNAADQFLSALGFVR